MVVGILACYLWAQNVGIGTTTPIWNLTVMVSTQRTISNPATAGIGVVSPMAEGDGQQAIIALHWFNAALPYAYRLWLGDPDGGYGVQANALELWEYPNTNPCCRPRFRIAPTRNLNYNRQPVTITANNWVEAYGFNVISDSSQKEHISPLPYGLSELLRLHPVIYKWDHESYESPPHVGFIAQEVGQVIPEAIVSTPEGTVGIDAAALTALLCRSIQELANRVESLEKWWLQRK
ncbi:MAG: tail fiber domain-containing protein [Bacteroidia bacterium]|nr:tail fiber domain-containing protein [Bacteroidia bacterium]